MDEKAYELLLSISKGIEDLNQKSNELNSKIHNVYTELNTKIDNLDVKVERYHHMYMEEFEYQRTCLAATESVLTEKLEILFDAYIINSEKFESLYKDVNSVRRTLEKHNRRLFRLKKTVNI